MFRGGGWRHGARAEAPQLQPCAGQQQGGGGGRSPVRRRRARLVAARAHRALPADDEQLVGRGGGDGVQGAGARQLGREAPDAELRGHRGAGRRRGDGDRGHGQRADVGAVRAVRVVPRPAGPAVRPVLVAVLRRGAVRLPLLRRAAAAAGHGRGRAAVRRRAAGGLQLRAQLPRRLLLPRRAGARQAEPGRGGHRRLRVRVRHQQPGPAVRRHVGPHGARPQPALARVADRGPVRRRVLLLPPAQQGVRRVGLAGAGRRPVGVPQLDPGRVHLDGVQLRPAAPGALLPGEPDRDHGRRPGGGVHGLLGQGDRRLGHRDHQPRAVGLQRRQGRVHEPARGVPAGARVLHPRHLLQHDRAQGSPGAQPDARVRRRRGGGGGLRRRALLRQQRLLTGVPGRGLPEIRGRDLHHRQLPAEEPEGRLRHLGVSGWFRAGDVWLYLTLTRIGIGIGMQRAAMGSIYVNTFILTCRFVSRLPLVIGKW
jgi:hypothetical protein